jgi:bifunctional DNA-binding transcriptional regulator/antitoxin component of YhaV-PrlF toxin-antitoxin module
MALHLDKDMRAAMDKATAGLRTKSDKIRALGSAHYERGDIARYLGIRYQHVRNVLVEAEEKDGQRRDPDKPPRQEWAQVGSEGRVVIPAPYRRLLGVDGGGHVLMILEDGEVRLIGRDAAIRRAQALLARYAPKSGRASEELIADRRAEAAREGQ